jgi:hypothetical protein
LTLKFRDLWAKLTWDFRLWAFWLISSNSSLRKFFLSSKPWTIPSSFSPLLVSSISMSYFPSYQHVRNSTIYEAVPLSKWESWSRKSSFCKAPNRHSMGWAFCLDTTNFCCIRNKKTRMFQKMRKPSSKILSN